jgi:endogenous inhibitor of DNA gyrase (YacG/DUF329 family)
MKKCNECGEPFVAEYKGQKFCSEECEIDYDNSGWRRSNYENKSIEDWDVDDHIAAWFDDMMEK